MTLVQSVSVDSVQQDQLQVAQEPTFTSLSHPADTMTGFCVTGENRTQETHSV